MFWKKFSRKFLKYMAIAVVAGLVVAALSTGVGAALGAAGVAGFGTTGAVGGMTALWGAVGSAMTTVGSSLGLGSAISAIIPSVSATTAALAGGIAVITSGVAYLALGVSYLSARREVRHEKALAANHDLAVNRIVENEVARKPQLYKSNEVAIAPKKTKAPEANTHQTNNTWSDRIIAERRKGVATQRSTQTPKSDQKQRYSHAEKYLNAKESLANRPQQIS